jgi:uncharacterized protein YyaL (SSP411 family)
VLESARAKLFAAREQRIRPGCDNKILTSWNALMIAGLARAARVFSRNDWLEMALRALDNIKSRRWRDGRLWATDHLPAYLDDHAYLLEALMELLRTSFRQEDLVFARFVADALLAHFEDHGSGGFYFTAHDHEQLIQRPKSGHDNAMPAGNGVAARALQRFGQMLGEPRYLEAARRTVKLYYPQMLNHAGGFATMVLALEEMFAPPAVNSVACNGVTCPV